MEIPTFGIDIKSKRLNIPFIISHKISATQPIIGVELFVNKIPVIFPPKIFYGTGSYPPFEKGLHLKMRHTASMPPFNAPYFSTASSPYWEQVG